MINRAPTAAGSLVIYYVTAHAHTRRSRRGGNKTFPAQIHGTRHQFVSTAAAEDCMMSERMQESPMSHNVYILGPNLHHDAVTFKFSNSADVGA